jgi:hypothetical protein
VTAWGSDTHITDVAEIESLTALHEVPGYVWCSKHEEIHGDTLNPRSYIEDGKQDYCVPEDHDALFRDAGRHVPRREPKGEYSGVEAEQVLDRHRSKVTPEPVRSNPTPMTVRRHTEESREIWKANLLAALPVDMLVEDRSKIADALLETTIKLGNEMRRKRLIDKLLHAAEQMEDWSGHKTVPVPQMVEWADILMDAAEEIRSVL